MPAFRPRRAILFDLMADLPLIKLEKLLIQEVSGVDDPANEAPGWAVQKAAQEADHASDEGATTILARVRKLIAGKDELEVDKAELTSILDERDGALVEKFVAAVSKSAEPVKVEGADGVGDGKAVAPVEKADEAPVVAAPAPAVVAPLTTDDVTKAIEEGLKPYNEIFEKVLDRLEAVEDRFAGVARKSIVGQESGGEGVKTDKTPETVLKGAFTEALAGRVVTLT